MATTMQVEKVEQPALAKHDTKLLDLAFAMDCTGSMGSYIASATENIRQIVETIVASEKGDVRLALVEYRDHPPQDTSFVTKVHDFTPSPGKMKGWLDQCQASGGGDEAEAVADALHDVLKLNWRPDATKICVCVSDAPPHGLGGCGDGFPDGCPNGIDPMTVSHQMAEKGITVYMVGCEPSIIPFKDFFMAVAYITGGQYVPLTKAKLLTTVIVGGAQEEMSLEQLMAEVDADVQADIAAGRAIDEDEFARRTHAKMASKGVKTKQLHRNQAELENATSSPMAHKYSAMSSLSEVRKEFKPKESPSRGSMMHPPAPPGAIGGSMAFCLDPSLAPSSNTYAHVSEPMDTSHTMDDTYACVEEEVTLNQAQRMVKKSMHRNMLMKK